MKLGLVAFLAACTVSTLAACTVSTAPAPQTPVNRPPVGQATPPPKEAPPPNRPAPPSGLGKTGRLEVVMKRTPCFGMCPMYTVKIHDDNSVEWHGEKYVGTIGDARGEMKPEQRDYLVEVLAQYKFFDLGDDGTERFVKKCFKDSGGSEICNEAPVRSVCTDTPHAIIEITLGDKHNTVTNNHCGANALDQVEAAIRTVANTKRWVDKP